MLCQTVSSKFGVYVVSGSLSSVSMEFMLNRLSLASKGFMLCRLSLVIMRYELSQPVSLFRGGGYCELVILC